MKKISIIFAMAALIFSSCIKEEAPIVDNNGDKDAANPSELLVEKVFTVGDVDTRTYIDGTTSASNKMVIKWCADDEIAVWDGTAFRKFTMDGEPNGNSATFKGMVSKSATEFYAIYPYNDNLKYNYNESQQWNEFTVTQPSVQYANPEGGLADNTAFSCGKADADEHIQFVNRSALLKFSLAEGMTVKSVTIKGNEDDDIISGSLNLRYNASNNFTLGWKSEGKSNELTLANEDGSNLKTGVDYYIALTGNKFDSGYSVTMTFADGSTMTRSSDKSIQLMSNQIYTLSNEPISRITLGATYYEAYQGGEDIVIGGKVYNKTTHPNATLLTETAIIEANGLYFLDPAEGQTITLGTTKVADIAIVGNDPSKRVTIQHSGFRLNSRAKVASMNVIFPAVEQQYIQEASDGAEYVVYDNCKIVASSKVMCYNEAVSVQTIGEFIMVNSEYEVPKAIAESESGAFLFNSYLPNSDLYFDNNIFYVDTPDFPTLKFKISTRTGFTINSVVMTNNTFVNMLANGGDGGYFKNGVLINSITANNNLFYVPAMTRNNYVFMNGLENASATTLNNVCYTNDNAYDFYMFGANSSTPAGAQRSITELSASPFSSMDHTNGVFVKTAAAAAYGAKR